jgi:lipoate-protein ligase A
MTTICRILPHERGDGPSNMAMDEALLDAVAENPTMAVVRTYEWSVPTLSLGYFQSIEEVRADPRWAKIPVVRRPTGGAALWHEFEVTYAVVVPGTHPASRPSRLLYRTIHEAIAERLQSFGIPAARRGGVDREMASGNRPFLCFTDRDEQDIVFRNVKVVGSAQRRRGGAVLQHGSLLLGRSKMTPELPGLNDLSSIFSDTSRWGVLLRDLLSEALRIPAREEDFRPEERRRAEFLRDQVYNNPSWTLRR